MLNIVTSKTNDRALSLIRVLHGFIILFITSQVSIPLQPVPITLQTIGVMLIGLTFNRKEGIAAVLMYLSIGAMGFPVFAEYSGGLTKLFGTTFGYFVGFIAAIATMTSFKEYYSNKNLIMIFLNSLLGTVIVFICGISWLSYLIGIKQAIAFGFLPFILPGLIKALITALSVRYIKFGKIIK
ncbi:MAG: biotin transporter BioY [Rickettsiaceae bacterium]|jgi:biotin transport system substrate-specific component|nr:biotin transporter BioY [Rickettsiaceae bacterium]